MNLRIRVECPIASFLFEWISLAEVASEPTLPYKCVCVVHLSHNCAITRLSSHGALWAAEDRSPECREEDRRVGVIDMSQGEKSEVPVSFHLCDH